MCPFFLNWSPISSGGGSISIIIINIIIMITFINFLSTAVVSKIFYSDRRIYSVKCTTLFCLLNFTNVIFYNDPRIHSVKWITLFCLFNFTSAIFSTDSPIYSIKCTPLLCQLNYARLEQFVTFFQHLPTADWLVLLL